MEVPSQWQDLFEELRGLRLCRQQLCQHWKTEIPIWLCAWTYHSWTQGRAWMSYHNSGNILWKYQGRLQKHTCCRSKWISMRCRGWRSAAVPFAWNDPSWREDYESGLALCPEPDAMLHWCEEPWEHLEQRCWNAIQQEGQDFGSTSEGATWWKISMKVI